MRPILKWVGGKRKLVPELLRRLPPDVDRRRHVEPFAGGAALYFARDGEHGRSWLSDANPYLVEFYSAVACRLPSLLAEAAQWSSRYRQNRAVTYADAREEFNRRRLAPGHGRSALVFDDVRPALFLFLNRTCFNGLWRVNKKGEFNVPMGDYKDPTIVDEAQLLSASNLLRKTTIDWCEFDDDVAIGYGEEDFVYFDPPYVPLSATSNFTSYAVGGFGRKEHERLAQLFTRLSKRGIPCLLSNSDTPLVRELYSGFRIDVVEAPRAVNCDATKRGPVREVIVQNEACRG